MKKPGGTQHPFDIELALTRLRAAVEPLPKAAMFELAERGYDSLFEQIVACLISIRTYDEVTLLTARGLFAQARTPEAISQLTVAQIDQLIWTSSFDERKAQHSRFAHFRSAFQGLALEPRVERQREL